MIMVISKKAKKMNRNRNDDNSADKRKLEHAMHCLVLCTFQLMVSLARYLILS